MKRLSICLIVFTCLCVCTWTKKGRERSHCRPNRQYPQLLSNNFSQNTLCYKTLPYSYVLTLNSSGSSYNIVQQSSKDSQLHNDSWITILDCCDGFKRNVTNNICIPVCTYECQENAYCFVPEVCACKFGYEEINGQCKPFCTNECKNGECVAPNVCRCNPGYILNDDNECKPVCEDGCVYGTCSADVCTCHEYPNTPNDRESCVLYCPESCSGECPALKRICQCRPGFANNDSDTCVSLTDTSRCNYGCGPNGRCVTPGKCECDPGYHTTFLTGRCIRNEGNYYDLPSCLPPCLNGYCNGPNQCICDDGYTHVNDDLLTCVPICEDGCPNGMCTLPNVCVCNSGYRKDNDQQKCIPEQFHQYIS